MHSHNSSKVKYNSSYYAVLTKTEICPNVDDLYRWEFPMKYGFQVFNTDCVVVFKDPQQREIHIS